MSAGSPSSPSPTAAATARPSSSTPSSSDNYNNEAAAAAAAADGGGGGVVVVNKSGVVNWTALFSMLRDNEDITTTNKRSGPEEKEKAESPFVVAGLVVDCRCQLGECVLYDDARNAVLWTDIYDHSLHELHLGHDVDDIDSAPASSALSSSSSYQVHRNLPKQLCSFGLVDCAPTATTAAAADKSSSPPLLLLCAWEDGFQLYDMTHHMALSKYSRPKIYAPNKEGGHYDSDDAVVVNPLGRPTRLNDGRTDRTGTRFVCGGYYGDLPDTYMKVYTVEQQQEQRTPSSGTDDHQHIIHLYHTAIVDRIQVTNSLCWSLDGTFMYMADSPTNNICRYDYDGVRGTIANPQLLHTKKRPPSSQSPSQPPNSTGGVDGCGPDGGGSGVPDGSCVDAEGYLWNATWRGGVEGAASSCVHRIHPGSGEVAFTVYVPGVTQVTCCCFGGPNLNVLFITTAAQGVPPDQPSHAAGGLFAVKVPFRGVKEDRFMLTVPPRK
jgi:sugar lactone lactonase YvrE